MVTTDADKYWAGFLWSARSQILKKRDGFLHESQQATPFSAPYLSQMADCRFQKRLFSDIQIFSWGKKIKMFWNFKLNLSHLCISLRLRILNPKLPEAQMFPHAGSQQARQQSAPPSILRLWAALLEFLGSEVSWRKNPHIWDSSDLTEMTSSRSFPAGRLFITSRPPWHTGAPPADPPIIDQRWSVVADHSQSARKP